MVRSMLAKHLWKQENIIAYFLYNPIALDEAESKVAHYKLLHRLILRLNDDRPGVKLVQELSQIISPLGASHIFINLELTSQITK